MPEIQNKIVSGMRRIAAGLFGTASPQNQLSAPQAVQGETYLEGGGPYVQREGPVFSPGAMNYVFQPYQETPVQPIWGHAFLRNPRAWPVIPEAQVMVAKTLNVNGIGGPVAGYIFMAPLIEQPPETGM